MKHFINQLWDKRVLVYAILMVGLFGYMLWERKDTTKQQITTTCSNGKCTKATITVETVRVPNKETQ